jgi:MFS family permease
MPIKRNLKLLTWFNFFSDFKLYAPIMVIYFAQILDSYALAMSIFSVSMIAQALFEVPTGIFSDKIGRKKTVVFGSLSMIVALVLYALGFNYWILFIGAIFEGLSIAFYSGNNEALLYDSLVQMNKLNKFDKYLGKTSSMFQLALAIATVIGGVIAAWSFNLVVWISVGFQFVALLISFFMIEPKCHFKKSGNVFSHLKEAFQLFLKNKKLRLLSLMDIIGFGVGEAFFQFQAAFYKLVWPIWALGIPKFFSFLFGFISFRLGHKAIKKFGAIKILIFGDFLGRFLNILAAFLANIFSPILMILPSFTYGASMVAKSKLLQKEFSDEQRSTMGSLISLLGSISFGVIAYFLGYIADVITPRNAIIIAQILLFPLILIKFRLLKLERIKIKK